MVRRSVGSVEAWWRALEAVRLLRGLSRRELARAIQDAVPRRASDARRAPSYAEVYHPGMLIPRAFAAMEALGCRLCGWRSLAETLSGLEDRRRSRRPRPATEASPTSAGSRTLLRDALASGELWLEIDDTDDATFEAALTRLAEGGAADGAPPSQLPTWPQTIKDPRVDAVLDRLERLESGLDGAAARRRPRRGQSDALEARLVALEARILVIEAALRSSRELEGTAPQVRPDAVAEGDTPSPPAAFSAGDKIGGETAHTGSLIDPTPLRGDDNDADIDGAPSPLDEGRAADDAPEELPSPGSDPTADFGEISARTLGDFDDATNTDARISPTPETASLADGAAGGDADDARRQRVHLALLASFLEANGERVDRWDFDDEATAKSPVRDEADTPTATPATHSSHREREKRKRKRRKKRRR